MNIEFEIAHTPSTSDLDFLTHQINKEAIDQGAAYPFAIFVRNKEGASCIFMFKKL